VKKHGDEHSGEGEQENSRDGEYKISCECHRCKQHADEQHPFRGCGEGLGALGLAQ
jgi:hypothetical protein